MASGYCIGPVICGCNENDYQDCSNHKKMLKQTQKDRKYLKIRPDFIKGIIQLPSVNDYAKWILSKYDLSDNFLSVRAGLWLDYNYILKALWIHEAENREIRQKAPDNAAETIHQIPLAFISEDARKFFINFLGRQT